MLSLSFLTNHFSTDYKEMDSQNREGSPDEKNTAQREEEETHRVLDPSMNVENALINGQSDSLTYDPHMIVTRDALLHGSSHGLNNNLGQPQQQESMEMEEEIPGIQQLEQCEQ